MAKKKNAKQIREEQKKQQKARWQSAEQHQKKETQEKKAETVQTANVPAVKNTPVIRSKKTKAKAAGMKSIFTVEKQLYTTSFGRGNDANLEARIEGDIIEKLCEQPNYELEKKECNLTVNGRNKMSANVLISRESSVKSDKMCLKEMLERKIFGKEYKDTLHVQIAYNIMDVQKIIALYSTQAVYALDNVLRNSGNENTDLIGNLGTRTYDEFIKYDPKYNNPKAHDYRNDLTALSCSPYLGYFGDVFGNLPRSKDDERKKRVYRIVALIGQLRQWAFHSSNDKWQYFAYRLDATLPKEFKDTLNQIVDRKIEDVNKDFIGTNKVNLIILKDLLSKVTPEAEVTELYYDFIVRKKQKNLGFSLKKLREMILDSDEANDAKDHEYDSVRNKLYKLIDFLIFHHYVRMEPDEIENMVASLRKSSGEEEKEQIYQCEAKRIWKKVLSSDWRSILSSLSGKEIKNAQQTTYVSEADIESFKIHPGEISYFSKLMYLLCCFIDGKEINELLTTLINKFDNIHSFIQTAADMGIECRFNKEYAFFMNSARTTEEITLIKSFARMTKPIGNAKRVMYIEACNILGYVPESDDEYDKLFFVDENGNKKNKGNHDFRNFIANNVVENDRFKYLVKYANIKKVRLLAKNETVVKFVLNQLPDEQIERYTNSCGINTLPTKKAMVNGMTDLIVRMDEQFGRFQKVNQKANADSNTEKQQCQSIISLYLTVLYLLVKNLVNINSRYVIGFYFVERDSKLYNVPLDIMIDNKKRKDFRRLTDYLLHDESDEAKKFRENGYFKNKKYLEIAKTNLRNSTSKMCTDFRNAVDHLNAVRNADRFINTIKYIDSYYDLYQYLIQKSVVSVNSSISYAKQLNEYQTYSKDFTKALCVPFAYNTPRFKNLSIMELFDKNN